MLRGLNRISIALRNLFSLRPKAPNTSKVFPNATQILTLTFIILLLFTGVLGAKYLSSTNKPTESKPDVQGQQATPTIKQPISRYEILNEVNLYRKSQNIASLNQDTESCKIADKILNKQFWRTDYNVNNYKDICPDCFALSIAQARDISSISSLINMWKSDSKTFETLMDTGKNACVSIDEGKVVLVVSKKNAGTASGNLISDPILDCNFTYLPDQKMKKSECSKSFECQIGGQWYIYTSRDKCSQDQKSNLSGSTTGGTYDPPSYPPCIIYYPALGYSQTYLYTSPEQCQQWKNSVNSTTTQVFNTPTSYIAPTASPEEIQALINQINKAISDCKFNVGVVYRQEVQNCNVQIGNICGSCSALDACLEIAKNKADREIINCENI